MGGSDPPTSSDSAPVAYIFWGAYRASAEKSPLYQCDICSPPSVARGCGSAMGRLEEGGRGDIVVDDEQKDTVMKVLLGEAGGTGDRAGRRKTWRRGKVSKVANCLFGTPSSNPRHVWPKRQISVPTYSHPVPMSRYTACTWYWMLPLPWTEL